MFKRKIECVQLSESSEDEDYVELPNVEDPPNHMSYKGNSDGFEVLECPAHADTAELIETSKGGIILGKSQAKPKVFTEKDWKDYFGLSEKANVMFHSNAIYSVIAGLDPKVRPLFWNTYCEVSKEVTPSNKHPNLNPQKYNQSIKQSLTKLQKRFQTIGYTSNQLQERNQYVSAILHSYAMKDPEVGFERGMQFLAYAIVDCVMGNPISYQQMVPNLNRYMAHVMRKLQYRGFYLPSKPAVFSKTKKLQDRIRSELPKIFERLESLNISCHKLFFKYYLSLFLHDTPQRILVSRLIELLLLQGEDFPTYLIMRILSQTQKEILQLSKQKLEFHIMNNLFRNYFINVTPEIALNRLDQLMIKKINADSS